MNWLLSAVLQTEVCIIADVRVHRSRLVVLRENECLLPTLSHLSAGQAVLFDIFLTIIRYADQTGITKSMRLEDIEGLVIVDEIDAHLHADVQYEVLPELVSLFPKVQFIGSSRNPVGKPYLIVF